MVLIRKFCNIAFFILCFPFFIYAHSGGLDSSGCHTNRKTGDYHCHGAAKAAPQPVYSAPTIPLKSSSSISTFIPTEESNLDTFSGKVIAVHDGDTISVMNGSGPVKIRLYGIDCPEDGQAFSNKAKSFTSQHVFGKTVIVIPYNKDIYGRTVADIILPDGKTLNHEITKAGFAWWFQKYAPEDKTLSNLEKEAKIAKLGLWFDAKPIAPWQYRTPAGNDTIRPLIAANLVDEATGAAVYITRTGAKYHRSGCRHLRSSIEISLKDAQGRGYAACKVCRP
jgi:micrococcal nuclease